MKIVGIVAEYNPLHSGHIYQLKSLKDSGYTHTVVVMSSNFVQRGEPAIFSKYTRAGIAIKNGADLVIEIPTPFAMSTAETFAIGSIALLKNCGVEYLSFGSECGDINLLNTCVKAINNKDVNKKLKELLKTGLTYSKARQDAIESIFSKEIADVLSKPNNTLGIEYINAIEKLRANIIPTTIKRRGADHDSSEELEHISASALRDAFYNNNDILLQKYMPLPVYDILNQEKRKGNIYNPQILDRVLLSKLRTLNISDIAKLPDISEGLENRIFLSIKNSNSFDGILENTKTKRYTMARLRRIYMYALLGITKDFYETLPPYIHILAMNQKGKEILQVAKNTSEIPINSSLKKLMETSDVSRKFAQKEIDCTNIYSVLTKNVMPYNMDLSQKLIVDK